MSTSHITNTSSLNEEERKVANHCKTVGFKSRNGTTFCPAFTTIPSCKSGVCGDPTGHNVSYCINEYMKRFENPESAGENPFQARQTVRLWCDQFEHHGIVFEDSGGRSAWCPKHLEEQEYRLFQGREKLAEARKDIPAKLEAEDRANEYQILFMPAEAAAQQTGKTLFSWAKESYRKLQENPSSTFECNKLYETIDEAGYEASGERSS